METLNKQSKPPFPEKFRIEGIEGTFTTEKWKSRFSCEGCCFRGKSQCKEAPECEDRIFVRIKSPRKSRAFPTPQIIESGVQVSPKYEADYQIQTINQLADVFEKSKSVYVIGIGIRNVAFMKNNSFGRLIYLCKNGKIWAVKEPEPEATGIKNAMEIVYGISIFAITCTFLYTFFRTMYLLFAKQPFWHMAGYTAILLCVIIILKSQKFIKL